VSRVLELTRAWAAITGLVLIALMLVLVALGYSVSHAVPMLIAGIVGYEAALTTYAFWRRRRHG
jgi:hypothetical protein